jgi:hypothetical protein
MAHYYARSTAELEQHAVKFWPSELVQQEADTSIIPALIRTQDKFISLMNLSESGPETWRDVLQLQQGGELSANLFLKHLQVLSDFGGEQLKRLKFREIFPQGTMDYVWREQTYQYQFKAITAGKGRQVDNKLLHIDGKGLIRAYSLDGFMDDIAMLYLHGGAALNEGVPEHVQDKCMLGSLIGQSEALTKFVKERYIWVSRITGGATSNALGQIAQRYVRDQLKELLPGWHFVSAIPGISENAGNTDTRFDIVTKSPSGKYTAIEVSFQVTTNSVIERKSKQAERRAELLHQGGHTIAYVLDGAGNFERISAIRDICQSSDCTVAYSDSELEVLAQFLRDVDEGKI